MNVVITNVPSGKFEIGPRSTSFVSTPSPVKDGRTAKPSDGSTTAAPMTPPRPIVASVRKPRAAVASRGAAPRRRRGRRRRVADELVRGRRVDGRVRARPRRGSRGRRRRSRARRRRAIAGQLITSPTRMQRDADREADRPEAVARRLRGVVLRVVHSSISLGGFNRSRCVAVNDATAASKSARAHHSAHPRRKVRQVSPARPSARRPARGSRGSSRSPAATRGGPRPGPSRSRRSRSCRRTPGSSTRGRAGRSAPR